MVVFFVFYNAYVLQFDPVQTACFGLLTACMFMCVLMHEYGHALMARRYGVGTRDIILSPIGGVARLERMPRKAVQELLIAIAGPMVNVVIAVVLAVGLSMFTDSGLLPIADDFSMIDLPAEFIKLLMFANVFLFLFNLVPAFPMDGGRILRSVLAFFMQWTMATKIASILARVMAVAFVVFGYWQGAYTLILIGIFIYFMAGREWRAIRKEEYLKSNTIGSIATNPASIELGAMLDAAFVSRQSTEILLVYRDHELAGYVAVDQLEEYFKDYPAASLSAGHFMHRDIGTIESSKSLLESVKLMQQYHWSVCKIISEGEVVGFIDRSTLSKHL